MKKDFWRITLDTNPDECNLRCVMCEQNSHFSGFYKDLYIKTGLKKRVMPKEWIPKILEQAYRIGIKEVIPTTMGDPLFSDALEVIIHYARQFNMKLNITHNGTFPHKSVEEWAKLIIPVTKDIKISFNGAKADTAENIMKGLNYDQVLSNIRILTDLRDEWSIISGHYCTVSLQLTFMRNNMNELDEIISLASHFGIDRIKGHHLWVHFPELEVYSYKRNNDTIKEWNSIVRRAHEAADKYRRWDDSKVILENIVPLENADSNEVPENYSCPFLGKELWISASGKISPCCAPDNLRGSLGDFGNIQNTGLEDAVNSKVYLNLLKNYKSYPLCKKCNMRKSV